MSTGTRNADELLVAVSGDVYVAPVDTPTPTLVRATLHPDFYKIGFVSEEGVSLAVNPEVGEEVAWQEQHPVRRDLERQRIAVTFDMLQWNAETVRFALGGEIRMSGPNEWVLDFPDSDGFELDERAIVIDWDDGDEPFRLVFKRGTVLGGLTTTLSKSSMAVLPIGFDVLATDDDGSPGSLFFSTEPPEEEPPPSGPGDDLFGEGTMGSGTMGGT